MQEAPKRAIKTTKSLNTGKVAIQQVKSRIELDSVNGWQSLGAAKNNEGFSKILVLVRDEGAFIEDESLEI